MRKLPWCSPGRLKRLTPRLMYELVYTVLPGDEEAGQGHAPVSLNGPPAFGPPSPKRGSRAEYESLVRLVMTLGSRRIEDANAEWERKRGPIPPPEG